MGAEVAMWVLESIGSHGWREATDAEILAAALPLVREALEGINGVMAVASALSAYGTVPPGVSTGPARAAIDAVLRVIEAAAKEAAK